MQEDFHYYATYCAASIAGYSPKESAAICYCANFVDLCSDSLLAALRAPRAAATTQLTMEMANTATDIVGIQNITRIWSSFHFLPRDLHADVKRGSKAYKNKYRLICGPNGDLLVDTVELAKGKGPAAAGIAMHVLADTWAHMYFAGTPSQVINNTDDYFFEEVPDKDGGYRREKLHFRHNPLKPDDADARSFTNSLRQSQENAIMNLGHGRAGHLPDYSFMRYCYLPAWNDYEEIIKDNPSDYYRAFCQMVYALKYLRGEITVFEKETYDTEAVAPLETEIREILRRRQTDSRDDWRELGKKIAGEAPEPFDAHRHEAEYLQAGEDEKNDTLLGAFILGALSQKSMVTNKIFKSGNLLAGFSTEYDGRKRGLAGIRDFHLLIRQAREQKKEDRHG